MPGEAMQIVKPIAAEDRAEDSQRFCLNDDLLQLLSSSERLAKSRVAVVSVAGAFRKGKSFLLNFFLRYLRALEKGDTSNWIGSRKMLDDGFHWSPGCKRDTTGILVWPEPFFIHRPNGEEVAVLLMDTQGTFDHQSTQLDCMTIFAFSTLLSSVQIFNISQNIQETDLQYLRLFVEFAAMVKQSEEPVLQNLWFLVRDWQCSGDHEFGVNGGKAYLEKVLECDSQMPNENQELRRGIQQHFQKASCCLLPHPGLPATQSPFNGEVDTLEKEFVMQLESFVSGVLSPENLVVKKINGNELTGAELLDYFRVYFEPFRLDQLPSPKTIFIATLEIANMTAAKEAKQLFENGTQCLLSPEVISKDNLGGLVEAQLNQALEYFDLKCMGREVKETKEARKKLERDLRSQFERQLLLKKNQMLVDEKRRMEAVMQEVVDENRRKEAVMQEVVDENRLKEAEIQEVRGQLQDFQTRQQERMNQENQSMIPTLRQLATDHRKAMEEAQKQIEEMTVQHEEETQKLTERHTRETQRLERELTEQHEETQKLKKEMTVQHGEETQKLTERHTRETQRLERETERHKNETQRLERKLTEQHTKETQRLERETEQHQEIQNLKDTIARQKAALEKHKKNPISRFLSK